MRWPIDAHKWVLEGSKAKDTRARAQCTKSPDLSTAMPETVKIGQAWWLRLIILATWEEKIERSMV
jgi:hypothetical protein